MAKASIDDGQSKVRVNVAGSANGSSTEDFSPSGCYPTRKFSPDTFPQLFARRVAVSPHAPAFSDVSFEGQKAKASTHSWSAIDSRARRAASALVLAGIGSGDRVVLCLSNTSAFLSFFLGAQAVGAIPVPLPSARDVRVRDGFRKRVDSVIADCEPGAVVVDSHTDVDALPPEVAPRAVVAETCDADGVELDGSLPDSFDFARSPDEIAFIQYTSGSTDSPKGVLVTHANLLANLRAIASGAGLGPSDIGFNWLPLYHDMGLIGGLLLGLYVGGGGYIMPTRTFIGGPALWLRAMSQFKATFASAPNFAFSLLARHMRDEAIAELDLSQWRRAFNGAEPIDRSTVDAFMKRFATAGFRAGTMCTVYGLAESTLAVSIPSQDSAPGYDFVDRDILSRDRRAVAVDKDSPGAVCFVSVGFAVPEHHVRIVDPDSHTDLPDRHVGEVTVLGPSVTPGYYQRGGGACTPRRELRTGDLGYVADGELYIVDRLKDLVIVGGRNIVPSDVERLVASVSGVRYGAVIAFAIRGSEGTDELFVVAGAAPRALQDPRKADEIKVVVQRYFQVTPKAVVLVPSSIIPRTSSGKIQRAACRALYESGAFRAGRSDPAAA
jgi:acyl-CoA synthetase (AMP-forming)/AMP-acid ligase II